MNRYGSFKVFSLTYGVAYMGLFWLNEFYRMALFRYYPTLAQHNGIVAGFSIAPQPAEVAGPGILWYSWLVGALVISLALCLVVPRKMAERLPHQWIWVVSAALTLAIMVYERRWFY